MHHTIYVAHKTMFVEFCREYWRQPKSFGCDAEQKIGKCIFSFILCQNVLSITSFFWSPDCRADHKLRNYIIEINHSCNVFLLM